MPDNTIYVFFSDENSIEAQRIVDDLKKIKINCIADLPTIDKVNQITQNESAKGLLIISDNFLKSITETRHLDQLLEEQYHKQIIPILTHGRRPNKDFPNKTEVYPTNIKTLNNVMYYRDYWYEEWIRLRKKAKLATESEQSNFKDKKEIAKKMSVGSISNYIRKINNFAIVDWDAFCSNGYQILFDSLGLGDTSLIEINGDNIQNGDNVNQNNNEKEDLNTTSKKTVVEVPEESIDLNVSEEVTNELMDEIEINQESKKEIHEEEADINSDKKNDISEQQQKIEETKIETVADNSNSEEIVFDEKDKKEAELNNPSHKLVKPVTILADNNSLDENDLSQIFDAALNKIANGNYDNATACYERILELDPYNGKALIGLARVLSEHYENKALMAANTYRKAIMVYDKNEKLYYEYAMLLKDKFMSYNKASDSFREALDINPSFEKAYLGLAFCQKEMGMNDQAKANYLQSCVLNADQFQTVKNDTYFGVIRTSVVKELPGEMSDEEEKIIPNPNADKVVLVTGASSGIGKCIAEQFILNGYKVIVTAKRSERLENLKKEMETQFDESQIHCLPFDICNLDAVKDAINNLPEAWSNIDILINNAGLAKGFAPIQEGNIDNWEVMINTNIKGLLYMSRMVTPGMVERKKGHIVNLGSVAGTQAYSGGGAYCATKAAVDSLTRSMRLDLYKHNIKVSSISPGHVDNKAISSDSDDNKSNIYSDFKPLSVFDIAETVYYVVTRPAHVNIQDVLIFGTQQASATDINRNGRKNH